MRVAHVITGLGLGGAEGALFRLICSDDSATHCLVVSLTCEGEYGVLLRDRGIKVIALGLSGYGGALSAANELARQLVAAKADVVQTWMYHADLFGGIVSRRAGIPVVWGVRHLNLSWSLNRLRTVFVARGCAVLSPAVPYCAVFCSNAALDAHRQIGYSCPSAVIPNGLDFVKWAPRWDSRSAVRAELGLSSSGIVIGHVSRADPQKDHDTLFAAFAMLRAMGVDASLVVAGTGLGGDEEYVKRLAETHGVSGFVKAIGPVRDVARLMAGFDLFVLSSRGESFPNVVVEAMACELPCIVTDVGDSAQIVGSLGWVAPPGSPAALAASIREAVEMGMDGRRAMGRAARVSVQERYDITLMRDRFRSVWSSALKIRGL